MRSTREYVFKAMIGEEEREKRKHMGQWEERGTKKREREREIFMLYIESF